MIAKLTFLMPGCAGILVPNSPATSAPTDSIAAARVRKVQVAALLGELLPGLFPQQRGGFGIRVVHDVVLSRLLRVGGSSSVKDGSALAASHQYSQGFYL